MGKRNQERRRAKKKQRDTQQRARGGSGAGPFAAGPLGAGGFSGSPRQTVADVLDAMLVELMHTPESEADAVTAEFAAQLAALDRGPAQVAGVSRALLGVGERVVRGCWERGWQPADLVRLAGRELTGRHARFAVSLIAAELRRYPAASLDAVWAAQVGDLNTTPWWDDDGSYLDAVGQREGVDRLDAAAGHLRVLRLFGLVPPIVQLGPLPGAGRGPANGGRVGRPAAAAGSEPDSRMLNRIRALLAKAESTDFAEEAEALTSKAQQLMARHSISVALLDADEGGGDEPAARRIGIDNPYEGAKAVLLTAVADANRCRAVWTKQLGFSTVVGYPSDLAAVELLYTSLLVQATTAMNRAGSRQDRYGRSRTRAFRQSFLVAYGNRIGQRLAAATDQATRDAVVGIGDDPGDDLATGVPGSAPADPRLLPVLAARDDAVRAATEAMFSELTTHAPNVTDREGWAHGTAAADRAVLHGHTEVGSPA